MNIGKQIHILLKKNIEVYVKGLGTFRRVHTPSTFDPNKNVYLPPVSFIEFDAQSTEGYDLATYIQQAEFCERTEAENQVEQAVFHIKEQVATQGQVMLDSLGQLVGYGNSYVFKPLDLSGFAFGAVEVPVDPDAVVSEEPKEEEPLDTVEQDAPVEEEQVPLENTPIDQEEREEEKQEEDIIDPSVEDVSPESDVDEEQEEVGESDNRSFIYGLLAALAVLVIGGLYYYSQYYQEVPMRDTTVVLPLQDTVPLLDTTDMLSPTDTLGDLLIDSLSTGIVEDMPIDTPAVQHKYTIVIGTHPTLAKAYEEAEAFNKDGHKSVRVVTPNLAKNLKRVIWDTYATKEERDSALRYVRKHIKTDAWPDMLR